MPARQATNSGQTHIKGDQKKPIAGYIPTPWGKYPPNMPVPPAPDSAEAKAGGGGGGATSAGGDD